MPGTRLQVDQVQEKKGSFLRGDNIQTFVYSNVIKYLLNYIFYHVFIFIAIK